MYLYLCLFSDVFDPGNQATTAAQRVSTPLVPNHSSIHSRHDGCNPNLWRPFCSSTGYQFTNQLLAFQRHIDFCRQFSNDSNAHYMYAFQNDVSKTQNMPNPTGEQFWQVDGMYVPQHFQTQSQYGKDDHIALQDPQQSNEKNSSQARQTQDAIYTESTNASEPMGLFCQSKHSQGFENSSQDMDPNTYRWYLTPEESSHKMTGNKEITKDSVLQNTHNDTGQRWTEKTEKIPNADYTHASLEQQKWSGNFARVLKEANILFPTLLSQSGVSQPEMKSHEKTRLYAVQANVNNVETTCCQKSSETSNTMYSTKRAEHIQNISARSFFLEKQKDHTERSVIERNIHFTKGFSTAKSLVRESHSRLESVVFNLRRQAEKSERANDRTPKNFPCPTTTQTGQSVKKTGILDSYGHIRLKIGYTTRGTTKYILGLWSIDGEDFVSPAFQKLMEGEFCQSLDVITCTEEEKRDIGLFVNISNFSTLKLISEHNYVQLWDHLTTSIPVIQSNDSDLNNRDVLGNRSNADTDFVKEQESNIHMQHNNSALKEDGQESVTVGRSPSQKTDKSIPPRSTENLVEDTQSSNATVHKGFRSDSVEKTKSERSSESVRGKENQKKNKIADTQMQRNRSTIIMTNPVNHEKNPENSEGYYLYFCGAQIPYIICSSQGVCFFLSSLINIPVIKAKEQGPCSILIKQTCEALGINLRPINESDGVVQMSCQGHRAVQDAGKNETLIKAVDAFRVVSEIAKQDIYSYPSQPKIPMVRLLNSNSLNLLATAGCKNISEDCSDILNDLSSKESTHADETNGESKHSGDDNDEKEIIIISSDEDTSDSVMVTDKQDNKGIHDLINNSFQLNQESHNMSPQNQWSKALVAIPVIHHHPQGSQSGWLFQQIADELQEVIFRVRCTGN